MKNLKTKLVASVAMLLIAVVMMSTASYAWFTISTNPEIANIATTVQVNGNLEIALDAGGDTPTAPDDSAVGDAGQNVKWGNLIDLQSFTFAAKGMLPATFTEDGEETTDPDGNIYYPVYGLDGRIASLAAATPKAIAAANEGGFTNFTDGKIWEYTDEDDNVVGYRIDFWLRSNFDGDITLCEKTDRGAHDESALGSVLTADLPIRIWFYDGNEDETYVEAVADETTGALTCDVTSLTANTAKLVSMFFYVDAAQVENLDLAEVSDVSINIQFASSGLEEVDPYDQTGEDYDRDETTAAAAD